MTSYLHNGDKTFSWKIRDSSRINKVTAYVVDLTSQKWQNIIWRHQLTVLIPPKIDFDGALLFISGGDIDNGKLKWRKPGSDLDRHLSDVAANNRAVVAVLYQVPNQPLLGGLREDALISRTLHDFEVDHDFSRPLLFPMVKIAVRSMDAIEQLIKHRMNRNINRFVVSGASKRGWTTWLTSAVDDRVVALGPMVIDILNMPVNLKHQLDAYGEYSDMINDYAKLGILDEVGNENGREIIRMIDPYSYRKSLNKPKFLFMGTNDPYWVIDNVMNYINDIPGITLIHYVPNAGHDLNGGATAFRALSAFLGITLSKGDYPEDKWRAEVKGNYVEVTVSASGRILEEVKLWYADSDDKDFRNEEWTSRDIEVNDKSRFTVREALPKKGFHAFYVDMTYKDANGGTYTVSTRAFMTDSKEIL